MNALITRDCSYSSILADATKVKWRVQDLIGHGKSLDFSKPFLPEQLAHTDKISCLTPEERLMLNQIRGHSYLHLFGLVEEFILPLVLDYVQTIGCTDITATQAYLGFAEEESKHIHLFRQFAIAFVNGFGHVCHCIGPPETIADFVLQHSPLGVALMTLHIEWMTQCHFLESVRDNHRENLDPLFRSLLRHHWQEEAQHARLDSLMVRSMVQHLDTAAIATGVEDYLAILQYLKSGLINQVQLDLDSLETAINRPLSSSERQSIQWVQAASYQQVFLTCGMTHPSFRETVQAVSPSGYARIAAIAQTLAP